MLFTGIEEGMNASRGGEGNMRVSERHGVFLWNGGSVNGLLCFVVGVVLIFIMD